MLRALLRVAVAAGLAATAYAALPISPASAAGCSTAHGVTVVVDFHELGGGVQTACVADGGGDTASQLFPAAGFPLSYVQRQPGFVCRVSGKPADDPCVSTPPADAYWALWWSDGKSGSWSYASAGAGGQRVPDGGYVAFSWNGSDGRVLPGYNPAPHPSPTPTPSPTPSPTHSPTHAGSSAPSSAHPSQQPSPASATPSASGSASQSPSKQAQPGDKKSRSPKPSPSATPSGPSASPSATPDAAVTTSAEPAEPDDGGLPTWLAPAAIVVLFGAAGAAAVVRRRRGGTGA